MIFASSNTGVGWAIVIIVVLFMLAGAAGGFRGR